MNVSGLEPRPYGFKTFFRGQDKTANFTSDRTADFENDTKPPISKMRQNRRFRKRDKTADFENETKPPTLMWDTTTDFVVTNKLPSKLFL